MDVLIASNLIYSDDNYFHFFEYDLKILLIFFFKKEDN